MTEQSLPLPSRTSLWVSGVWRKEKPWLAVVLILLGVWVLDAAQAGQSLELMLRQLASVAPFLAASVLIAAWANATGADGLISRAFVGAPTTMIIMGALAGALSPFCSCGVIPLIAALLAMGVPLAPVMAFWLASPLMDPAMFALTTGIIGVEFALAKALVAIGMGLFGGALYTSWSKEML
ncbi:permease [Nitrincola sp. A-D6]|uniref:permease n=1 Tax=Nitrincola sp. A-D6 TaxID=1545442 RepID=UPI000A78DABF|nr:permease [Nitrincola sp. A-D6]